MLDLIGPVYEETTTALIAYPEQGLRRIRLIRKLAKRKKIIRIHYEILTDDVRSYAKGERFKSQFMAPPPNLHQLYEHRPLEELIEAAKQTKDYIRGHRDNRIMVLWGMMDTPPKLRRNCPDL